MGMTCEATRFLLEGVRAGISVRRTVTLGRQDVWVGPERLEAFLREFQLVPATLGGAACREALAAAPGRFEALLRLLGAESVSACDASGYEGATLLHDLNQPIPPEWIEQFDLVLDGGTLEHIFNFPVALANCLRMVKPAGHLILLTPANNYCGHGFYQFSPELFWRVLSSANGFELERMHAVVDTEGMSEVLGVRYSFSIRGPRYAVADPAVVRQRVLLANDAPVLLFIQARKTASVPLLTAAPQQSDYVPLWQRGTPDRPLEQSPAGHRFVGWLRRHLTESFCREVLPKLAWAMDPLRNARFRRRLSFRNRALYRRVPR
ncbi:MAG: class I SAM-dependent methyltransferase [Verrucomicrobia bacterium]|nr:class I SAM-dependent methyltransferase [Verrucomicrobiota bacterium]